MELFQNRKTSTWISSHQLSSKVLSSVFPSGQDGGLGRREGPQERLYDTQSVVGGGVFREGGQLEGRGGLGGRDSTDDTS